MTSARSRRPRMRSSCSTLNVYSKAAPSQVHIPCPIPITRVCRWPARSFSIPSASACAACPGAHTDSELPSGPSPGGGGEVQLRPGRVDQVVVAQPFPLALPAGKGEDDVHSGLPALTIPAGRIATALAWRNSMPWRRYTGASGKVTCWGDIRPTPTKMFDGIQFQSAFGDTTTTSWPVPSNRRRCRAAVCPEIPAPRITTRAMTCLLAAVRKLTSSLMLRIPSGVSAWNLPDSPFRRNAVVTVLLPPGPGQLGGRLAQVEGQAGEFQLQRGQAAGQRADVGPAALPQQPEREVGPEARRAVHQQGAGPGDLAEPLAQLGVRDVPRAGQVAGAELGRGPDVQQHGRGAGLEQVAGPPQGQVAGEQVAGH